MLYRKKYPKDKFPFSDDLCEFMENHSEFYKSLKLYKSKRFIFIPVIGLSHLPASEGNLSNDEIIGMFYYDINKDMFKQDYVVNVGGKNQKFISYTQRKIQEMGSVFSIDTFYKKYGKHGKYYYKKGTVKYEHHYNNVEDLPNFRELKLWASKIKEGIRNPQKRSLS